MTESVFKETLFEGKKVFISGGSSGMCLGFAQSFLNHCAISYKLNLQDFIR